MLHILLACTMLITTPRACFGMQPTDNDNHLIDIDLHAPCRRAGPGNAKSIVAKVLSINDLQQYLLPYIKSYKDFRSLARTSRSWHALIMPILKNNELLLPYIYKGPTIDETYIKESIIKLLDTAIITMTHALANAINGSAVAASTFPSLLHYQDLVGSVRTSHNPIQFFIQEDTITLYHLLIDTITINKVPTDFTILIPLILFAGAPDTIAKRDFERPTYYHSQLPLELAIETNNAQACKYLLEYGSSLNTPIAGNITYLAHKVIQAIGDGSTLSLDIVLLYNPNPNLLDHHGYSIKDFMHNEVDQDALDEYTDYYDTLYNNEPKHHDTECTICEMEQRRIRVPAITLPIYLGCHAILVGTDVENWVVAPVSVPVIIGAFVGFWSNLSRQIKAHKKTLLPALT